MATEPVPVPRGMQELLNQKQEEYTSYTYIGMGVTSDPPNVYSLVTRSLPLSMAYWYMAVILFVAGGENDECFYIRKRKVMYNLNVDAADEKVKKENKKHYAEVSGKLRLLKEKYTTPHDFYVQHANADYSPDPIRRRRHD